MIQHTPLLPAANWTSRAQCSYAYNFNWAHLGIEWSRRVAEAGNDGLAGSQVTKHSAPDSQLRTDGRAAARWHKHVRRWKRKKERQNTTHTHTHKNTRTHRETYLCFPVGVWPANSVFYKD